MFLRVFIAEDSAFFYLLIDIESQTLMLLPAPYSIASVPVHPIDLQMLLRWIRHTITRQEQASVMYANAHAVNLAQQHPTFQRTLQQADVVFCDGYGVWLAGQLLGWPLPERFTPPDWIMQLARLCAQRKYRLFLLGALPNVAGRAAHRLQTRFPQLEITSEHGYFYPHGAENEQIIRKINHASPDILLVGMGMPRQEIWVQQNLHRYEAHVTICVGALFDYLAGEVRRGPRWLTDSGGEWLWRLAFEPKRLWRRYLLGNPAFIRFILQQWIQKRVVHRVNGRTGT